MNRNFESLLERIFGIPAVKNYRIEHPADWHRLMNDFEMKKRGRRAIDRKDTRISLPQSFRNSVSGFDDSDLSARLSGSYRSLGVEIYNDEFLCLGPSAMVQLFQPVINGIVSHMAGLLCKPALSNLSHLFLVGGFAESAILQDEMKKAYSSRYKILTPRNAGIAVVQGATMFGKKPSVISSRKMASTYGFRTNHRFDPDKHPANKKTFYDGVAFCEDIFEVVVKEDESIKTGEKKQFSLIPSSKDQTQIGFSFFSSSNPNAEYTTDPGVGSLMGEMIVDSPDTTKGIDRPIKLILHFGGTEIKATAVDDTSGNTAVVYLDFLCKS